MRQVTLEVVLGEARRNNRVCPQPKRWNDLYNMLPETKRKDGGWEPAAPLILAAWWAAPALLKMMRLREHIEWASSHGCLDEVYIFLSELPETEWHHLGE